MKISNLLAFVSLSLLMVSCQAEPADTASSDAPEAQLDTAEPTDQPDATVLFLGDSITAGYGLEDDEQAFPAFLQEKTDSLGWSVRMVNAGLSGETSAGGLRRVDWLLRQPIDVMVIELGGNDGLRGLPISALRENIQGIIDKTREAHPAARIALAGMQIPPNLGVSYTQEFQQVYKDLAASNDVALIPFELEKVVSDPGMMQNDGIHPTEKGQRLVADIAWKTLYPMIELVLEEKNCLPISEDEVVDPTEDCPVSLTL